MKLFLLILFCSISFGIQVQTAKHWTLSGFSSGGFMATQMLIAHSFDLRAIGIVDAGPFYCAQGVGHLDTAKDTCFKNPTKADMSLANRIIKEADSRG
jgi:poly(3-hydroxybutyrate) depolymerase